MAAYGARSKYGRLAAGCGTSNQHPIYIQCRGLVGVYNGVMVPAAQVGIIHQAGGQVACPVFIYRNAIGTQ